MGVLYLHTYHIHRHRLYGDRDSNPPLSVLSNLWDQKYYFTAASWIILKIIGFKCFNKYVFTFKNVHNLLFDD